MINGIPNAVYFEDSIADDTGGESDEGVNRSVVISTPQGEAYHVIVAGVLSGASSAWITAYSQDGSVQLRTSLPIIAVPGSRSDISIQYNPNAGTLSTVIPNSTFDTTLTDIGNSVSLDLIGMNTARTLGRIIGRAKERVNEGDVRKVRDLLKSFMEVIKDQVPEHINPLAAQVLSQDAAALLRNLPKCKIGEDDNRCEDGRKGCNERQRAKKYRDELCLDDSAHVI